MVQNRFNLVDEPWIPVVNDGLKSMKDVFSGNCKKLGGTPREKISILKLLLAISQAASTPDDYSEWYEMGVSGLRKNCLSYLENNKNEFFLYGSKPFLQMPVQQAKIKSYGSFLPEVATGNRSRLTDFSNEFPITDAEKALILVCEMSMCLGGKKVDNKVVLNSNYQEKKVSGVPGPGMCSHGLLHVFLTGKNILETLWLNLLDMESIDGLGFFKSKLGTAPWEKMPENENCKTAQTLKSSLLGRLVPLARFCFLEEDGMHCTEGIRHPDYLFEMVDPSTCINRQSKKAKMIWADTEKKPWRSLAAIMSFLDTGKNKDRYDCINLNVGIKRLRNAKINDFCIWCGGLQVSNNSGEQYATGNDDNVESEFPMNLHRISADSWYTNFKLEMYRLEKYSHILYASVNSYLKSQKMNSEQAKIASGIFWEKVENFRSDLMNLCEDKEKISKLHKAFIGILLETYDKTCPANTARQIFNWAKYRPFLDMTESKKEKKDTQSQPAPSNTCQDEKMSKINNFVKYVFERKEVDTGFAAKLRRGDNRATEYYAYEPLVKFCIDLQKDNERIPFLLVGAAICRDKCSKDGEDGLGTTLAKCLKATSENKWEKMSETDRDGKIIQGSARIRRLLACDSIEEVCLVLRQIITYIQSNMPGSLSYSQLLADISCFESRNNPSIKQNDFDSIKSPSIKRKWAKQFFEILLPQRKDADSEEDRS